MFYAVKRLIAGIALLLAPVAAAGQTGAAGVDLEGFDAWVTATMAEWRVPGLAVAAIKDGEVVLAKGYGFRDVEQGLPVTGQTVMPIGSNSKSFTVVLMGMLADEKKLEWEVPVRTYLPDFQMYDDVATQQMTPFDLVTHRSGLPRHDNVWYGRDATREELFHRLRYLEPTVSFRGRYQYQNLMFMTAGYLTERITGQSWDQQIHERIFDPLGMKRASTSVNEIPASGDFSHPYTVRNDSLVRLPFRNIDPIGPAGSINASVDEMLHYIQFRLDRGEFDGQRLLSADTEKLLQSPYTVSGSGDHPELGPVTYGGGLSISTYRGHRTVSHGGGIDGFSSGMSWLPDDGIGVMVLTNLSGSNPLSTLVARMLYDRLLGLPPVDWVDRQRKTDAEAEARRQRDLAAVAAERKTGTTPTHPMSAHAGRYEHPGYGPLSIRVDGPDLIVTLEPTTVVRLKHFHFDVWEVEDPTRLVVPLSGLVHFSSNLRGEIDRVYIPFDPNGAAIEFTRSDVEISGGNDR